jgi:hypothetical protein
MFIPLMVNVLCFKGIKEAFHRGVTPAVFFATHVLNKAILSYKIPINFAGIQ